MLLCCSKGSCSSSSRCKSILALTKHSNKNIPYVFSSPLRQDSRAFILFSQSHIHKIDPGLSKTAGDFRMNETLRKNYYPSAFIVPLFYNSWAVIEIFQLYRDGQEWHQTRIHWYIFWGFAGKIWF